MGALLAPAGWSASRVARAEPPTRDLSAPSGPVENQRLLKEILRENAEDAARRRADRRGRPSDQRAGPTYSQRLTDRQARRAQSRPRQPLGTRSTLGIRR